jgi:hypothetical protein
MNHTLHTVVGELLSADLDIRHGLPTLTMYLRQAARGYTSQAIVAMRSYPSTLAAGRQAQHDHAALGCGRLCRVTAEAMSSANGTVYLLGVVDAHTIDLPRPPYFDARVPGAEFSPTPPDYDCSHIGQALAMSLPAHLQGGAA